MSQIPHGYFQNVFDFLRHNPGGGWIANYMIAMQNVQSHTVNAKSPQLVRAKLDRVEASMHYVH
jgi:hypothetical protein